MPAAWDKGDWRKPRKAHRQDPASMLDANVPASGLRDVCSSRARSIWCAARVHAQLCSLLFAKAGRSLTPNDNDNE